MATVLGIVAEYNPFHNGHAYQLRQAKQQSQADVTVVVMSGNWMQRGEPALIDKWQRTRLALLGGVDLVIELPFQFAVQPAHLFAQGAIQLLSALGCTTLAFGAEHPDLDFETLVANQPTNASSHFKQFDETYPTLFNDYLQAQTGMNLRASNDILGFSYVAANRQLERPLEILPIQRRGSSHQETQLDSEATVASGAAIRYAVQSGDWPSVARMVPAETLAALQKNQQVTWSDYWPYLRYQLLSTSLADLHEVYQMSEGIEYRLKQAALTSTNFDEFLRAAKTKRFTYARLQRLCVYILLQVNRVELPTEVRYAHVLGFDRLGQRYLNQVKKRSKLPLISRVTDDWINGPYRLDYQAGLMRQMLTKVDQDRLQHAVIV
ncbi:nucleotidyltransferase [Secundilactobacillus silagincola]|uniref:tRNA(Met) cytidine acetate ligase n=1 Tax=Secundilactobacillus silagincola TaxID=1714681 RepID=A0A1Z5J118_9LACO|nr:nucleotidyltransferase [Secundilactobacillus silagincola]GAX07733.1 nucleotidyltransferase [Secundilactobacillus silagincola]